MARPADEKVTFDLLLRGESDDASVASAELDKLRPPPEAIEKCFQWLSRKGVTCHRTAFGLACESPEPLFETLFKVKIKRSKKKPASNQPEVVGDPKPPSEIRELVSQVTLTRPPELF